MLYADWHLDEKDYEIASKNYEIIYKKCPNFLIAGKALYMIALCQEELLNYDKALDLLSELESKYTFHFYYLEAMLNKGRILQYLKKYDLALELYEKLLQRETLAVDYRNAVTRDLNILQMQVRMKNIPLKETTLKNQLNSASPFDNNP